MSAVIIISLFIGLIIGTVLGLTGAGGSIFAVPLLILLLGLPINNAIGIALGAVAVSALIGTISNWQAKYILWIPALALGLGGALFAPLGKYLGNQLPDLFLLLGFSVLAFSIAIIMWRQSLASPEQAKVVRSNIGSDQDYIEPICRFSDAGTFKLTTKCFSALLSAGVIVGLLSGLFGVGGGFLIVPILLFITQVSMRQAVATSLLIITLISAIGFFSFVASSAAVDWQLLTQVCSGGLLGMLGGHLIADKIAGPQLQRVFAISLIVTTLVTLGDQFFKEMI
jgi:uncharacterized membrane protein YfcA